MFCVLYIMAINATLDVTTFITVARMTLINIGYGNLEGLEGSMNLLASLLAKINLGLLTAAYKPWLAHCCHKA